MSLLNISHLQSHIVSTEAYNHTFNVNKNIVESILMRKQF